MTDSYTQRITRGIGLASAYACVVLLGVGSAKVLENKLNTPEYYQPLEIYQPIQIQEDKERGTPIRDNPKIHRLNDPRKRLTGLV